MTRRDAPQDALRAADDGDNEHPERCNHLRHRRNRTHRAPHGYYRVCSGVLRRRGWGHFTLEQGPLPSLSLSLSLSPLFSLSLPRGPFTSPSTLLSTDSFSSSTRRSPRASSALPSPPLLQPGPRHGLSFSVSTDEILSFNLVLTSMQGRMQAAGGIRECRSEVVLDILRVSCVRNMN